MDTINLEITTKESIESSFVDAGSKQTTVATTDVRAALPQVEHVHSIEPTTLLWLLLVYFICRMAQPFIAHRRRNDHHHHDSTVDTAAVVAKKTPVRRNRTAK